MPAFFCFQPSAFSCPIIRKKPIKPCFVFVALCAICVDGRHSALSNTFDVPSAVHPHTPAELRTLAAINIKNIFSLSVSGLFLFSPKLSKI